VKALFVICGVALVGLTVLAVGTLPQRRSDVPVIYWNTDPNPARTRQVATFMRWMRDRGLEGVDLRLDTNNQGTMKIIIQSASGVGSEVIDVYGGGALRQLVSAGVLRDVTDLAAEYGYSMDRTYPGARDELSVDGRQYAFPCNVTANILTINRAFLTDEEVRMIKFDWNWDEFLAWALKVQRIDEQGRIRRYAVWPSWGFSARELWAVNGGGIFNETMTRCTLDSPKVLEATRWYYDLMFTHHVIPTPVEAAALPAEAGYGGPALYAVAHDHTVAVAIGRYGLIQLRKFKNFKPAVAMIPYRARPMQFIFSRAAAVNAGAPDPRLAARFQQFLASEAYNRLIIDDADALPPDPKMTLDEEYLKPKDWPEEHGVHEKYAVAAWKYGVSREYSMFINPVVADRVINDYLSGMDSRTRTIEDALRDVTDEVNLEIRRTVERDPKLRPAYEAACRKQADIDRLKAEGKPVPPEMIDNPVLRRMSEKPE
jgi:multiple sugar transport system substrate-binding protein